MTGKRECKCSMAIKVLGEGCDVCNPARALEHAKQTISDQKEEIEGLERRLAELECVLESARRAVAHKQHGHYLVLTVDIAALEADIAAVTKPEGGVK